MLVFKHTTSTPIFSSIAMMKKLFFMLLALFAMCGYVLAQGGSMNYWYMGKKAGMKFNGNAKPTVLVDGGMDTYGGTASVSDEAGNLLFYTDGKKTYDRSHGLMNNGNDCTNPAPYKSRVAYANIRGTSRYLVFVSGQQAEYFEVDMSLNGGLGSVTRKKQILDPTLAGVEVSSLTIVNNCRDNGYWLIAATTPSNFIRAYRISEEGVSRPVISDLGQTIVQAGDIASTADGSHIALTQFSSVEASITLYCSFDKTCGKIVPLMELISGDPDADYAYGLEFSKSGQFLYVVYSVAHSQIYQFDLFSADPNISPYLVATSDNNFNQLQMGPDGRIYANSHRNGIPGPRIDAITSPEEKGANCGYQYNYLDLGRATEFELPWFPADREQQCPAFRKPLVKVSNTCLGSKSLFEVNADFHPDSFYWDFGVNGSAKGNGHHTEFEYPATGNYSAKLVWHFCGLADTIRISVKIGPKPVITLAPDTIICAGTGFWIDAGDFPGASIQWNTGDTSRKIFASDSGEYRVTVSYGDCSSSASRKVKYWPSVWSTLGGEHFLCEEEDELVKLDAGKGFSHYKWTPTGDTTQWIIVEKVGPYFVMVTDWRGCSTESGTQVKRKCPVYLYMPNSFTPNGDGLNDLFGPVVSDATQFSIEIYNTWGTLLFSSDNPSVMWDGTFKGKACEEGVYCWKLNYQGYVKSQLRNFNENGVIHLLR